MDTTGRYYPSPSVSALAVNVPNTGRTLGGARNSPKTHLEYGDDEPEGPTAKLSWRRSTTVVMGRGV